MFCTSGRSLFAHTIGKFDQIQEHRARSNNASATIAPGVNLPKVDTEVDINEFHCSFGHVHKEHLLRTAEERGVTLRSELRDCEGCSMPKECGKPIAKTAKRRADRRGGHGFLYFCGPKIVWYMWRKEWYMLLSRMCFPGILLST